ncbi:MAG: response regulator transcription factor [Bacteroidales bacterium]|nr:response regulator transcription factor [Bacteroidales bacterium]
MGCKKLFENNYSVKIVNEAQNGQELFDLLNHSTSDIISLGIQMPVVDGLAFLDRFNYQEEPKIISLSFFKLPLCRTSWLSFRASSYLDKSEGGEHCCCKGINMSMALAFLFKNRETIKKVVNHS